MIKPTAINNKVFALGAALFILASFILQVDLAIPLFLLAIYVYMKFSQLSLNFQSPPVLNLVLLFTLIFASSYFIVRQGVSVLYIPFAVVPMLTAILFGNFMVSLLTTLACSISVASIAGNDYYLAVLFLVSGIVSILLVRDVRRRFAVIRAGFIVGFIQALTLFFIAHFKLTWHPDKYIILFLNGIVSSFIVLATLPIFEILFKTVTNISLLELADFDHPLLQRMIQEAPGTYHHSLVVGNLSDAACVAVGAHALLARIGAYYHDIGKLSKPDYFSENQNIKESKHDALSPTMSKLVIMNHVKEGVELAKKYKLPVKLTEFIQQHHGSSLVYYFYRRALESLEDDHEVKEEGFRYPGPKPDTRETAIVLLADSVEAATRALKDPMPAKIEELVHKIINNKFIDGQLDECNLTLKELEKISAVFIHILSGIYHSRVSYPEGQKSENNHKKPAKEDSRQSEKDKKRDS